MAPAKSLEGFGQGVMVFLGDVSTQFLANDIVVQPNVGEVAGFWQLTGINPAADAHPRSSQHIFQLTGQAHVLCRTVFLAGAFISNPALFWYVRTTRLNFAVAVAGLLQDSSQPMGGGW